MVPSTSHLTRFFRNSGHFKILEYQIVPELLAHLRATARSTLTLLSAGCSTGQEAYSLAMLLTELLPPDMGYSILAVDRSSDAIERARAGSYAAAELAGMPSRLQRRYLRREGARFAIAEKLRQSIAFEVAALPLAPARERYDIVLCRNVLTYVPPPEQPEVVEALWQSMRRHSYLMIGGAESLLGIDRRFIYLESRWGSYYYKGAE